MTACLTFCLPLHSATCFPDTMAYTAARKLFTPNIRPIISTAKHIKKLPTYPVFLRYVGSFLMFFPGGFQKIKQSFFLDQRNALPLITKHNEIISWLDIEYLSGFCRDHDHLLLPCRKCVFPSVELLSQENPFFHN